MTSPVDGWPGDGAFDVGVPVAVSAEGDLSGFRLTPIAPWPHGPRSVGLGPGWFDPGGRPYEVSTATAGFTVVRATRAPASMSLEVAPPRNARWLVVRIEPEPLEPPAFTLSGPEPVALRVAERRRGVYRLALPDREAPWTISATDVQSALTVDPSLSEDHDPPRAGEAMVVVRGRRATVSWSVDAPAFAKLQAAGAPLALDGPVIGVGAVRGSFEIGGTVEGWLEDLAGNRTAVGPIEVSAGAHVTARLTEVVNVPLRDWGDSAPAGVPFDAWPGAGAVSDVDEWIELVHDGAEPVDLEHAGLEVHVEDGTPSVTRLPGAPAAFFGSGGSWSSWSPGEALVVRLRGAMSSRDLTVRLVGPDGTLDELRLGADGDHPGGAPPDAVHESVARTRFGWRWCVPSPGDPRPPRTCAAE